MALFERARRNGVTLLAVTDHDTLSGSASLPLGEPGPRLIPGVEFSCAWRGVNVHVLAYGPSWDPGRMLDLLQQQKVRRQQRAQIIAERLGRVVRVERLAEKVAHEARLAEVPGRPHFAQCLLKEGVVGSLEEAFSHYLGAGKIGDVKTCWPSLEELMALLVAARAVISLAHPMHYHLTASRLRQLLDEFGGLGGQCIEIAVPGIDSGHFGWLAAAARSRRLGQSFGSDYHGGDNPWRQPGLYPKPVDDLPSILQWLT